MKKAIIFLLLMLMVSMAGNIVLYREFMKPYPITDTTRVTIYDTMRVMQPVPRDSVVTRYVTVKLPTSDTVRIADTVTVEVPITQKVYTDSLYTAYVSGYHASLDSLFIRQQTTYIPVEVLQKPRVVVSLGAFGGMGRKGFDYGIGLTIGVPLWTF